MSLEHTKNRAALLMKLLDQKYSMSHQEEIVHYIASTENREKESARISQMMDDMSEEEVIRIIDSMMKGT